MERSIKSPFPGMDPYLESRWSDVHATLIGFVKEALQPELPRDLRARSEERVLVEEEEKDELRSYRSDIAVIETGRPHGAALKSGSATSTIEPVVVRFYEGPTVDRFVHIIDVASKNRVVTAIEILSPWNKCGGRLNTDYRRKLNDYLAAEVSVVEIDLLRDPPRGHMKVTDADIPPDRRAPYVTCVRRAWQSDEWLVYPMKLRERLPVIPIPLRKTDAEVGLDLQPLIERVYVAGGHDDIDYSRRLDPPLPKDDEAWVDQLLRQAGRRK
jgi:hypothetical protein